MKKCLYVECAKYYDLFVNKKEINKEIEFISRLLNKFKVKFVLDIGCGTGLYLIGLKKKGFDVEGLDLSKEMLKEVRKKSKKIKLYNKSMLNFRINKKYDAITCLSSTLLALPNFKLIEKAIKNFYEHLNLKGILFLDLPNHLKEIRECNNVKKHTSYNLPEGRFDSTEISCKKGNKWVEKWYGIVRKGNKVSKFKDIWEEFIFQPKMLVISLKKIGFKILKIYGSMMGDRFDKNKSWRIVYLCRK